MLEYTAPLPYVATSALLWLVPLLLLVAALASAFGARRIPEGRARVLAVAPFAGSGVAAIALLAQLAELPGPTKHLVAHGWNLVRVGSFDAALELTGDVLSLPSVLALLLVGAVTASRVAPPRGSLARVALVQATAGFASIAVLAGNFVVVAMGWSLATVFGAWLFAADGVGAADRVFARLALGDAVLLVGVAIAFWTMGGSWPVSGYTEDLVARAIPVVRAGTTDARIDADDEEEEEAHRRGSGVVPKPPPRAREGATGTITMLALPGAKLFLDSASTPFGISPFVRKVAPAGVHNARVVVGQGADDVEVRTFRVTEGKDTEIAALGPTIGFRTAAIALRVESEKGSTGIAARLRDVRLFGVPIGGLLVALFVVAAATRSFARPESAEGEGTSASDLVSILLASLGIAVLLRVAALFGIPSPFAATIAVLLALGAALGALATRSPSRSAALVTGAQLAIAMLAASSGDVAAALLGALAATTAGVCLVVGSDAEHAERSLSFRRVAAAVLSATPPGLALSWALAGALRATFTTAPFALAFVLAAGVVATAFLTSMAAWRIANAPAPTKAPAPAPKTGKKKAKTKTETKAKADAEAATPVAPAAPVGATAWLALVVAVALAVAGILEGRLREAVSTALGSPFADVPPAARSMWLLALVVALLAAAIGWVRSKSPAPSDGGFARRASDALASLLGLGGASVRALGEVARRAESALGIAKEEGR